MEKKLAKELLSFLNNSPTSFHATSMIEEYIKEVGFKELFEEDKWEIKKGGKYYIKKNNSAIIAFEVGNGELEKEGFRLIGAHTDSPGFKIKPNAEMLVENHYVKLNTEVYGGPILSTWFDRPLSIAGRVVIKGKSLIKPEVKLLKVDRPILIIPNLAIHMNRSVNEGFAINKQKDTLPFVGFINDKLEKQDFLINLISNEICVNKEDILDFDLFLYEYEKGCLLGVEEELISAGRLDDLWMVYCGVKSLKDSTINKATKVMIAIDNEEIGSLTSQGANSSFIKNILERICLAMKLDRVGFYRAISNSIMISADLAHAIHPNYGEKHDPVNRPVLGKGPVIKKAASGSYSTDAFSSAIFRNICSEVKVPVQEFVNRSDVRGGTTIGPMMSADLSIPVIDMGAPLLGMHSVRELASVIDNYYCIKAFTKFYEN